MTRPDPDPRSADSKPSWLRESCPRWCARIHQESDHVEDHYHQSEPSVVPVIAGSGGSIPVTASLGAVDLVIRMGRHVGELLTWVTIEPAEEMEPRIVLTVESARSVLQHLDEQLRRHPDP